MPDACQVFPACLLSPTLHLCVRVHVYLCVRVSLTRKRKKPRKQAVPIFTPHSIPVPSAARHPSPWISRLDIQQHPRPLSNSVPCASIYLLFLISAQCLSHLPIHPPHFSRFLLSCLLLASLTIFLTRDIKIFIIAVKNEFFRRDLRILPSLNVIFISFIRIIKK